MSSDEQLILQVLMLRCQIGDAGALAELIAKHESPLRYFISRLLGDLEMTEDIFQDTWLSVLRRITTLKNADAFAAWLYRIAHNKVYDQLRRKRRLNELNESLVVPGAVEEPTFSAEDAAAIHKSLTTLNPQHKEVLMLRFLELMALARILSLFAVVFTISLYVRSRTLTIGQVQVRLAAIEEQLRRIAREKSPAQDIDGSAQVR